MDSLVIASAQLLSADQIVQALIGFGAAIVGAVVGGFFVTGAARGQWKRDRDQARLDSSKQAARRIMIALSQLEGALATWLAGGVHLDELASRFNEFSVTTVSELPFITDDAVSERVRAHTVLGYQVIAVAREIQTPRQVIEATRRHADAVTEALEAHIAERRLPAYQELKVQPNGVIDVHALTSWPAPPAQVE